MMVRRVPQFCRVFSAANSLGSTNRQENQERYLPLPTHLFVLLVVAQRAGVEEAEDPWFFARI